MDEPEVLVHDECWPELQPPQAANGADNVASPAECTAPQAPGTELISNDTDLEDAYELNTDVKEYYRQQFSNREKIRDEIATESHDTDVKIGENLRNRLILDQSADPELHEDIQRLRKTKGTEDQFLRLREGLLEQCVKSNYPGESVVWVPVIPAGYVHGGETWKTWFVRQFHTGVAGSHRNAEKTLILMRRQVYWKTMKHDVEAYVERCKTCIRFRKVATKTPQVPVIPRDFECWEEVMVDLEGPCNPPDKHGHRYSMTYICCLCHGIFIETSPKCNAAEVRRMFSNCMFRSGRMPRLVRSDRGPEFKNALVNEYLSMLGVG